MEAALYSASPSVPLRAGDLPLTGAGLPRWGPAAPKRSFMSAFTSSRIAPAINYHGRARNENRTLADAGARLRSATAGSHWRGSRSGQTASLELLLHSGQQCTGRCRNVLVAHQRLSHQEGFHAGLGKPLAVGVIGNAAFGDH